MSSAKNYKSLFDPSIETDIYNYITEFLIKQRLELSKKNLPKCPFWRKEYQTNDYLKWLGETYQSELTEVKKICKVFDVRPIIETIKSTKIFSLRYAKLEQRKSFIYALYLSQSKHMSEQKRAQSLSEPAKEIEIKPVAKTKNKGSMLSL